MLNVDLIKNPWNWLIVTAMVATAIFAINVVKSTAKKDS